MLGKRSSLPYTDRVPAGLRTFGTESWDVFSFDPAVETAGFTPEPLRGGEGGGLEQDGMVDGFGDECWVGLE
jgi:hypothetical protein